MKERGGSYATGQRPGNLQMVGVDAIGNGGQEHDAGARFEGLFAASVADRFRFVIVGAVGHVQVMGFGGPKGENGNLPALRSDKCVTLLRQSPLAHSALTWFPAAACGLALYSSFPEICYVPRQWISS